MRDEGQPGAWFDSLDPRRDQRSLRFEDLAEEIVAGRLDEVRPALARVGRAVGAGLHAAGFIAYEAGPAFDRALAATAPMDGLPLLRFGIYRRRSERDGPVAPDRWEEGRSGVGVLEPTLSAADYGDRVRRILELIAAGDTYQVNLTFRLRGNFQDDDVALYRQLCVAQRSGFCALLRLGRHSIVSASPELFFRKEGSRVEMRPMKGTRHRGRWSEEDEAIARGLAGSAKERAENLMIVDLLRNDLGRVAEIGSVEVPRLFEIETFPTVHQMTSTVTARVPAEVDVPELMAALFPSGSVTGAPKIRTSQIIRELEGSPRGPYTGAIGFWSEGEAVFSVAIRTALLDRAAGTIEVGVGSGITADSKPAAEYRECLAKGAFLRRPVPRFQLIESLRLDVPGGYRRREEHLARLAGSARYFAFTYDSAAARAALDEVASGSAPGTYKVRLLLDRSGRITTTSAPIPPRLAPARLRLARSPVEERDPFLFHKTTHRTVYERALATAGDVDDVILFNRRHELTEATAGSLVVEIEGSMLTPPLEAGLLPGVFRAELIRCGRVRVRSLSKGDLRRAARVYVVNSVRGWREGVLLD
jgi:para-aminobenzoate synthetase / 4-amino-4-deoxychorismate lyase